MKSYKVIIGSVLVLSLVLLFIGFSTDNQDLPDGEAIYKIQCTLCHGSDGNLGVSGSEKLPESTLNLEQRIEVITYGRGKMNAFNTILSDEEIEAVARYTMNLK